MGSLLESLRNLQSIEEKLAHVKRRLKTRQRAVKAQESKINALKEDKEAKHQLSMERRMQSDQFELELKDREEQVTKLRGSLNTAKTNKEYAAILTQINTLKADNAKIEEDGLKVIQDVDDIQAQMAEIDEKIAEEDKKLSEISEQSSEEIEKLNRMLEKLEAQKNDASQGIPAETLAVFDRLAERYDGEAMAMIEIQGRKPPYTYICGGCFMSLTSEHANALRVRDEIRNCDNCGRILYMDASGEPVD